MKTCRGGIWTAKRIDIGLRFLSLLQRAKPSARISQRPGVTIGPALQGLRPQH